MDDLVTWLRAQLDETEVDARFYLANGADNGPGMEWAQLALAEVDAKRRIIDEHQPSGGECRTCCGGPYLEETWDGEEERTTWKRADLPYPCPTLRLLALPCADRPGYRDEWRPTAS